VNLPKRKKVHRFQQKTTESVVFGMPIQQ